MITRNIPCIRQPQVFTGIKKRWLDKKPVFLVCPSFGRRELITGIDPTKTGTINDDVGMNGRALSASATSYLAYSDIAFGGTDPISIVVFCDSVGTVTSGLFLGQETEIVLRRNSASNGVEFILNSFTTNDRISVNTVDSRPGGGVVLAGTYGPSGKLTAYANKDSANVTPTGTYANISGLFSLLGNGPLPSAENSKQYLVVVFASELSQADVFDLVENPYDVFKPQSRNIYTETLAAGGTVIPVFMNQYRQRWA